MNYTRTASVTLCILLLAIITASASYAGDRPLNSTFHEEIHGGFEFTTGNSTYEGTLERGGQYFTQFSVSIPPGSKIRYQRLYVYWTWSKNGDQAVYPEIGVSVPGDKGSLERDTRFTDTKGFASKNDFFSGMDSYNLPLTQKDGNLTIMVDNTATDNSTFAVLGMGILTIYESPDAPRSIIQVLEGCDLLYSSYGITPEMATNTLEFKGPVDISKVNSARLLLVAPSGGYSRTDIPEKNRIIVNRIGGGRLPGVFDAVLKILFPANQGKVWTDVFSSDEQHQIGIEEKEIRPYLRPADNVIEVQDNGDYFELTNAVLAVEYNS